MQVVVAIVAHKHQRVLPCATVCVGAVGNGFVNHSFGIGLVIHGEASHRHVQFVVRGGVQSFAIVEQSKEAIVNVTGGLAERVFALVAQQQIVGVERFAGRGEQTVVPHAVAEEQQIAWQVGIVLCAVVQHF